MAERRVFLDTSGVYAWINKSDPWHQNMCALPKVEGSRLIITDYVVDEVCSLFVARKIPHQRRLFDLIDHSRIVDCTWIGSDLFAKAREWMFRYEDQPFSFTDCTSFACMEQLGIREVATTDRHFLVAGFDPLFVQSVHGQS